MEEYHVSAYDEKTGRGLVRHLYLRANQARQALCCLVVNGRQLPHSRELVRALRNAAPDLVGLVLCVNTKKTNVILGSGLAGGDAVWTHVPAVGTVLFPDQPDSDRGAL